MYLPAHFNLKPSPMHVEIFDLLQKGTEERGLRLAVAAPRGHAKSTIASVAYILWCICYQKEQFIYLISHTLDQAADNLSHIKRELTDNARLLEDFPEVCEPPGSFVGAPRWRKDEIITRNDVKVTALGAEKKIRGRRHKQHRPSLIILDDVENEEEVRSADQRRFKQEWFNKSVLKAGCSTTNVVVVGTVLHYDSLLAGLLSQFKGLGWTSHKNQAVTQWSEHLDMWAHWEAIYAHLQEHQGLGGPRAAKAFFEANHERMLKAAQVLWPE